LALRLRRRRYLGTDNIHPGVGRSTGGGVDAAEAEELKKLAEKHKEHLQRLQAEFENFRRRSRQQMEDLKATANINTIEAMLPVLDNFGRALQTPPTSIENFLPGVKMIYDHFLSLLKESGLEVIDPIGQTFDPNIHDAVAVDSSGEHPENQVIEVMQNGYRLKDKLLRPAVVKVARKEA
jgi:molecular chaperone GrpE